MGSPLTVTNCVKSVCSSAIKAAEKLPSKAASVSKSILTMQPQKTASVVKSGINTFSVDANGFFIKAIKKLKNVASKIKVFFKNGLKNAEKNKNSATAVKKEVSKKSESVVKKGVSYMSDEAEKFSKSVKRDVPRTVFSKEEAGAVRCTRRIFYPEDIEIMEKLPLDEMLEYKLKLIDKGRYYT